MKSHSRLNKIGPLLGAILLILLAASVVAPASAKRFGGGGFSGFRGFKSSPRISAPKPSFRLPFRRSSPKVTAPPMSAPSLSPRVSAPSSGPRISPPSTTSRISPPPSSTPRVNPPPSSAPSSGVRSFGNSAGKTPGSLGGSRSIGGATPMKEPASTNPTSLGGTKTFAKQSPAPLSLGGAKRISTPLPKTPIGTTYSGRYASASRPPDLSARTPLSTRTVVIDNRPIVVRHYGGWGDYSYDWGAPRWYYYAPWHPAFYFHPPVLYGGAMYPGGVNYLNVLLGAICIAVVLALILRAMKK